MLRERVVMVVLEVVVQAHLVVTMETPLLQTPAVGVVDQDLFYQQHTTLEVVVHLVSPLWHTPSHKNLLVER
jgi:hypothetical protein